MTDNRILVAAIIGLLGACGGGEEESGGTATPTEPQAPASELQAAHLPPSLQFVHIGETTPEEVKAQYTAENLYVTDTEDRELTVRARGSNTGRPTRTVNVTRKTNTDGYIGELGEEYGSIRFSFTPLTDGGPFVLYGVEISQADPPGNVCAPAASLASGSGLEGCDENAVYRPSAPDAEGNFHACINHTEGRTLAVRCSSRSDVRALRYELAVGRVEAP